MSILAIATCMAIGMMLAPGMTFANSPSGIITVNSNSDSSTSGDGLCTLREAIANANAQGSGDTTGGDCEIGVAGTNTIEFNTAMTISPSSGYVITSPIIIDGTANSAGTCSTKSLGVVIDGSGVSSDIFSVGPGGNNSTIKGLVLENDSSGYAINANGSSNVVISCNIIGLNQAGTAAAANENGINVNDTTNDIVGGTDAAAGNIVSGNTGDGIETGNSAGLTIGGNLIGLGVDGTTMIGNGDFGISDILGGDTGLTVGGPTRAEGNIIMGNGHNGIWFVSATQSTNVSILDNTIAGNTGEAGFSNIDGFTVQGNYFGLDPTGTMPIPMNGDSLMDIGDLTDATIGGTTSSARNYFVAERSDSNTDDVSARVSGIAINTTFTNSSIIGNYFGVDVSGDQEGDGDGIIINNGFDDLSGLVIGGTSPGDGNVIAGANDPVSDSSEGILVTQEVTGFKIFGNLIGTNPAGEIASGFGNRVGIHVSGDNLPGSQIGGTATGEGNTIAGNGLGILFVNVPSGSGGVATMSVLGNSIYGNTSLAGFGDGIEDIYFNGSSVTESGPNINTPGNTNLSTDGSLNHPVIASAVNAGSGNLTINYSLDVAAGNYRVEFFKNPTVGASTSGYGEGEDFIGYDEFTSTGSKASKTITMPGSIGDVITATATQDLGSGSYGVTSEFSNAVTAVASSTETPTLSAPASGTYVNTSSVPFTFTIPEAVYSGSLKITLTPTSGSPIILHLSDLSGGQIGTPITINITPDASPVVSGVVSVSPLGTTSIPNGTYTVEVSYQDTLDDSPATANIDNVVIADPVSTTTTQTDGTVSGGILWGCKDPNAINYNYSSASKPSLCVYKTAQVTSSNPSASTSTSAQVSSGTAYQFPRTLREGMRGNDVVTLQKFLKIIPASIKSFGPKTKAALMNYQKLNHLVADGIAGPKTRAAIEADIEKQ